MARPCVLVRPMLDTRMALAQPQGKMNPEKLAKMAAQVRTGGKGSVRRKKKAIHKTTTTDDKRLQNTLKRLGVNNIPAIEEVRIGGMRLVRAGQRARRCRARGAHRGIALSLHRCRRRRRSTSSRTTAWWCTSTTPRCRLPSRQTPMW